MERVRCTELGCCGYVASCVRLQLHNVARCCVNSVTIGSWIMKVTVHVANCLYSTYLMRALKCQTLRCAVYCKRISAHILCVSVYDIVMLDNYAIYDRMDERHDIVTFAASSYNQGYRATCIRNLSWIKQRRVSIIGIN